MKKEFSKRILILDYIVLAVLVVLTLLFSEVDLTAITIAWIGQLGISTGFYFWKARMENKVKVPIAIIESLPDELKSELDLTQVITSIIQSE